MTVRVWAVKVGELKPLSRGGLLWLAARCAMRVEPWIPPGAESPWHDGLEHVAAAAISKPARSDVARLLGSELSNRGAAACNRLAATDEALGRCMNYAALTLATALDATALDAGPDLKKTVIDSAKLSASIAAVLAHAGRVRVRKGEDPVDVACLAIWDAIRADIKALAEGTLELEVATDRLGALRTHAPLWVGGRPAWAVPIASLPTSSSRTPRRRGR
jgi:hypothetical protein